MYVLRTIGCCLVLGGLLAVGAVPLPSAAQSDTSDELPTVENPVVVEVTPAQETVAPGETSALIVTLTPPKFMWLGAKPGQDRTPHGTRVRMEGPSGLEFGEPEYPEPSVEGVPVHVGVTRVYEGEIDIIVPFRVEEGVDEGTYDVTAFLTYSPGFDAGGLRTKVDEPYSTTVRVERNGPPTASLPEPSIREVPDDFRVQPNDDFPTQLFPMFHAYEEGTVFTETLHTLFMDPPNHGKTIRHTPFPFLSSTNQEGNSFGGGGVLLNTTREGVMTGTVSIIGYHNEFAGTVFGFDYITCPAAYKNLQVTGRVSSDYRELQINWEDFTLGSNDRWGYQIDATAETDPRTRYYGLGSGTDEEDLAVYDHQELSTIVDFYHFPAEKLRVGIGYKIRHVDVGRGFDDIDPGAIEGLDRAIDGRFAPQVNDVFAGEPGVGGGTTTTGGRFNVIYDGRNQEFNPSRGFFGTFTAEVNGLIDDFGQDELAGTYGRFLLQANYYASTVDKLWTFMVRSNATFTTDENIPFYEQAQLGGPRTLRAFDKGRFTGQHGVFGSVEVLRSFANMEIMGFPMVMKMGAFVDTGQVFDTEFGDDFNVAPGVSLRLVNPPNVGYIMSVSNGQDGVNVTGGITLPF